MTLLPIPWWFQIIQGKYQGKEISFPEAMELIHKEVNLEDRAIRAMFYRE